MERLVVGRNKGNGYLRETPVSPATHGSPVCVKEPIQKAEPSLQKRHYAKKETGTFRKSADLLNLSPMEPLFSLFGREIFGEDILLLVLILLLIEENADKMLIGVLLYVFLG